MADKPEETHGAGQQEAKPIAVKCPKCGHSFFHKIGEKLKEAGESLGNAIGETKFGG